MSGTGYMKKLMNNCVDNFICVNWEIAVSVCQNSDRITGTNGYTENLIFGMRSRTC